MNIMVSVLSIINICSYSQSCVVKHVYFLSKQSKGDLHGRQMIHMSPWLCLHNQDSVVRNSESLGTIAMYVAKSNVNNRTATLPIILSLIKLIRTNSNYCVLGTSSVAFVFK